MTASPTMKVYDILNSNPEWFLLSRNIAFINAEGGRANALKEFALGRVREILSDSDDARVEHLESKDIDWTAIVRHLRTMGCPYRAES